MTVSHYCRGGEKNLQQDELTNIIEAILFVSGEPVLVDDMINALNVSEVVLEEALKKLGDEYDYQMRGLSLKRFGRYVQLATRAAYAPYVERLLQPVQKQSLSQTALETLAIVAYKQPVTKAQIESVRGVKCDYSVQSLVNKGLIMDAGRMDMPGRPILYATTDLFLSHFGISSLDELPIIQLNTQQTESQILVP